MERLEGIKDYLEKEINGLGYGLYHLEYVREMGQHYLRFYIEKDGGITLEDCEKVSRRMSDILDEKDPIEEEYFLEVSSPGIFRYLFTDKHLKEAVGLKVLVKTKKPVDGAKSRKGILISAGDETLELKTEKGNVVIPRNIVKTVNLEEDI